MDFSNTTPQEIAASLGRLGLSWTYDADGDVRVRFRKAQQPWIDAVFYELMEDFSVRGQFLKGYAVELSDGTMRWDVTHDPGMEPVAIAQKVVTMYFSPQPGKVRLQIHAAIAPLEQPRPMHIKVIPGVQQIANLERNAAPFTAQNDGTLAWMAAASAGPVDDAELGRTVNSMAQVGLAMFEGAFTGRLFNLDI